MNAFIAKMNATAVKMGMLHTHFTSPDGLPDPTETDLLHPAPTCSPSASRR